MAQEDNKTPKPVYQDFLIRGADVLEQHPGFSLEGRDEDVKTVGKVLTRRKNKSIVMVGNEGVGLTTLAMGLEAAKSKMGVPADLVSKSFYWLDTDALFLSSDSTKVTEGFKAAMATLSSTPDSVLVIDDIKALAEGIEMSSAKHIANILVNEMKTKNLQVYINARFDDLKEVYKLHPAMRELFSFRELREPDKDGLRKILKHQIGQMQEFYGIQVSDDALTGLIDLTMKYPGLTIEAQPQRSLIVLEGALTALRYKAHTRPMALDKLEGDHALLTSIIETGKPNGTVPAAFEGKSKEELTAERAKIEEQVKTINESWAVYEKEIRAAHKTKTDAEVQIRNLEAQIKVQQEKDEKEKVAAEERRQKAIADKKEETVDAVEEKPAVAKKSARRDFASRMADAGLGDDEDGAAKTAAAEAPKTNFGKLLANANLDSEEVIKLKEDVDILKGELKKCSARFKELTADRNKGLVLTNDHILSEVSQISGQPISKLTEDETERLINLEKTISKRVFGQDEVVTQVANYVRDGRQGMKDENRPIGNFLFIGPTGTGKTELVKALAEALFGSEKMITRFDMGGFQEKNTVSTLVGSPRGYEGYADGGLLTNSVMKKPNSIVLYDEVEKAHIDVFDLLLPVFDEGVLADTRGQVATFGGVVNIMTSNIGSKFFMEEGVSYEEAKEKALALLHNQDKSSGGSGFRPEFLQRLDGIFFFKSLEKPQIELVAGKALKKLNQQIAAKGLVAEMAKDDVAQMVEDHYVKKEGGRGIQRYIAQNIRPAISLTMLESRNKPGKIKISYNKAAKKPEMTFIPAEPAQAPANSNNPEAPVTKKSVPGQGV